MSGLINSGGSKIGIVGYDLAPGNPSFGMSITGNQTIAVNTTDKIEFNDTDWNIGGNFNTSTYIFTAPVAGTYSFQASMNTSTGWDRGADQFLFAINFPEGKDVYYQIDPEGYAYDPLLYTLAISTQQRMDAGDRCWSSFWQHSGGDTITIVDGNGTYFTGGLIGLK